MLDAAPEQQWRQCDQRTGGREKGERRYLVNVATRLYKKTDGLIHAQVTPGCVQTRCWHKAGFTCGLAGSQVPHSVVGKT
ncbi:hypothetical protein Tdes44962_MAKER02862 [Teratosphaeria destructans]|uniref:Uncharacterized protein n=1 Tax=Teratosphaeria destructans TaxID=418781 RepID=A0A9W7SRG0_9PEZI|nr:hypothetical protein Tdes44962_MAKER02862 [Teratosphaeria destructans]